MNILILGNGGREHALAWKCAQSPRVGRVYVAPGNAGTAQEAKCENVAIDATDIAGLIGFAREQQIALTLVGPEAPLVAGVVDRFREAGLRIFGPTAASAQLEGSKAYAKDFLARHRIPTAAYGVFTELAPALAFIEKQGAPIVVKADGLAAGKGVVVAMTTDEAKAAARAMLGEKSLGTAGNRLVIEEFLEGEEASFIVMANGRQVLALATSQDHKRLLDGDLGPNTGGMGAVSPAAVVTPALHARVMREVIEPTLAGLADEGMPYLGFLYAGLMLGTDGRLGVLEFNCRFGDPETQPVMMRLQDDLVDLIEAALDERLDRIEAHWDARSAVGVVMAAAGYPGTPRAGDVVTEGEATGGCQTATRLFHAGTRMKGGHVVTSGGRVLCVTALGTTMADAAARAYTRLATVHFEGAQFRRDIGARAVAHERQHAHDLLAAGLDHAP